MIRNSMTQSTPLRVLLVDDSEIVRKRVAGVLSVLDDVEVVGQAEAVEDARRLLAHLRPDVLILDHRLPDGTGLDVLRNVRESFPHMCVIVLTNHASEQYRQSYLHAGADHYLDKSNEFQNIADLLEQLRRGDGEGPQKEIQ